MCFPSFAYSVSYVFLFCCISKHPIDIPGFYYIPIIFVMFYILQHFFNLVPIDLFELRILTRNKENPGTNLFLVPIIFWSNSCTLNKVAVPGLFPVLIYLFGLWILTRNKGLVQAGFAPDLHSISFVFVQKTMKITGASRRIWYRIIYCPLIC